MLSLNVPFVPNDEYLRFLLENEAHIQTLHYSLYDPGLQDARIHLDDIPVEKLIDSLKQLKKTKKYVLANGRFHSNSVYTGGDELRAIVHKLDQLSLAGQLDGVIFSDSYFLTALGNAAPSLAASIEAVPSVNFQIDAIDKLAATIEFIRLNGFASPAKVTLDRSLNRKSGQLAEITEAIRKRWPQLQVELLANEGCLSYCPSRLTHEALISFSNCCKVGIDTKRLNDNLACVRWLSDAPYRILGSPFIRPEDVSFYEDKADVIKICGRTLGPMFLKRTIGAYVMGTWNYNLLELLDASHWMADYWDLPNRTLPKNFLEKSMLCRHDCTICFYCKELFEKLAVEKSWTLSHAYF